MSTSTYGTGESPEIAIFREMTGGIGKGREEPIRYQPRAPLVLPPSGEHLPPPVENAEVADAAWPRDHDSVSGGKEFGDENPRDDISPEEYRRLRPLAAIAGQRPRQTAFQRQSDENRNTAYAVVNAEERETFQAALDEADGVGQTGRRYLTDPPETFRAPAATAPTEFEDIKKKRGFFLTRWMMGG